MHQHTIENDTDNSRRVEGLPVPVLKEVGLAVEKFYLGKLTTRKWLKDGHQGVLTGVAENPA